DAEAALQLTLGRSYESIGDYARGEEHLRRAIELARALPERDDDLLGGAWLALGSVLVQQLRFEEAQLAAREALELARARFGPESARAAAAEILLARALSHGGRHEEAEPLYVHA